MVLANLLPVPPIVMLLGSGAAAWAETGSGLARARRSHVAYGFGHVGMVDGSTHAAAGGKL